jgi:methylglutaconyl-CoA hydratase
MKYETLVIEINYGVGIIWMNRPDQHNALNGKMISELAAAIRALELDPAVRVVVLAGVGKSFCSGADMSWIKRIADDRTKTKSADVAQFTSLLNGIHTLKKPTISRVHGPVVACGAGLVAACDIAVAAYEAEFCLSEVRLGLIPALIGPYVMRAMGERAARRYFLSAESFTAAEAYRVGLVSDLAPLGELDARINELLGHLLQGGTNAQMLTKDWIRAMEDAPITSKLIDDGAARFTAVCNSAEGREGICSSIGKRRPAWLDQTIKNIVKESSAPKAKRKRKKVTGKEPSQRRRR